VLIVDNNSKDQTRAVAQEFIEKYPGRFRYLFEAKQGKSNALNTGIHKAHGDVLAFMDDDVEVEPAWLQNLTAELAGGKWAGTGGRVLPAWKCDPPRWLPMEGRYALAPLVMFDPGLEAGPLDEAPFGTNMAFVKGVFEKYGLFRTDLGPRPGSEIRNEDTEFGQRLLNRGERFRYEPTAVVYHEVPEKRLQKQFFLNWWFDKARADIREYGVPASTRWFLAGVPLFLFRRLAVWTLRWMITFQTRQRFSAKTKVWARLGEIQECYRKAHATGEKAVLQNR
jgi:glycosyltransferase involved in cell wall biosynthesis